MKQSAILFIILLSGIKLSAQLKQGRVMVGGHVNFGTNSFASADTTSIFQNQRRSKNLNFSIRAGFFVTDRIMIGLLIGQNSSESQAEQLNLHTTVWTQRSSHYTNSVGLFGRVYKMLGQSKFAMFGQVSASLGRGESMQEYTQVVPNAPTIINKNSGTNMEATVYLNLGITYFATPRIAIETYFGNLGYRDAQSRTVSWDESVNESHTREFYSGLNFNLSNIFLGISFYLGGIDETPVPVSN